MIDGQYGAGNDGQVSGIFVSYSRKDDATIDRIEASLREHGFDPRVDQREIAKLEDWWSRVESLIADSDALLFAISSDSLGSAVCRKELAFAASLNKRLAPILQREIDAAMLPSEISHLNWIDFREQARFSTHDLAWCVRQST